MSVEMRDDVIAFTGGSLLSAIPALQWLWPMQAEVLNAPDMAMIWVFKIFGTVILGFLGGITGMLGKDAYRFFKHKLKHNEDKDSDLGSDRSGDRPDR